MRALTARFARGALALGLLLLAAAAGCGGGPQHGRVMIMVPWSGDEFRAFYSVVQKFQAKTGIHVDFEVTRAQTQQLDAAVAAGAPPDLAMVPSIGAIDRYVQERRLRPLDVATGTYAQPFRGLATVEDKVYAVPVKADVKSLVWYDPADFAGPKPTLASLLESARSDPRAWCLGLASGPTSGWPGADWIADILLAQGNGDTYKQWLSGDLKWATPQVGSAWTTWRSLVGGSVAGSSTRQFGEAARGMTAAPATCRLDHGTMSAMSFPAALSPGTNYDYVTSSPNRRLEVSADFVGMFTGNPNATALIDYLAGAEAQRIWVNALGGYALSADSRVPLAAYDNPVQQAIATMLQPHSGYTLCFSAADTMTPDLSAAFYRAVLDYATGAEQLPNLLAGLDKVQYRHDSPVPPGSLCASRT
jgi:alpha-glucoside transport system substrate-binding protein